MPSIAIVNASAVIPKAFIERNTPSIGSPKAKHKMHSCARRLHQSAQLQLHSGLFTSSSAGLLWMLHHRLPRQFYVPAKRWSRCPVGCAAPHRLVMTVTSNSGELELHNWFIFPLATLPTVRMHTSFANVSVHPCWRVTCSGWIAEGLLLRKVWVDCAMILYDFQVLKIENNFQT